VQGTGLPQIAAEFGVSLAEASSYRDRIYRQLRLSRPGVREYSRALGLAMPRSKPR
jgi:hypothetical protein